LYTLQDSQEVKVDVIAVIIIINAERGTEAALLPL
jgi:hypothetical protein